MDPITITAIANLLAQLIPAGINLYSQLEQNASGATVTPLATVLASANANWLAIAATAQAQLNPPAAPTS